jgi:hypothetical protein
MTGRQLARGYERRVFSETTPPAKAIEWATNKAANRVQEVMPLPFFTVKGIAKMITTVSIVASGTNPSPDSLRVPATGA